jgi:hypothetical protein
MAQLRYNNFIKLTLFEKLLDFIVGIRAGANQPKVLMADVKISISSFS